MSPSYSIWLDSRYRIAIFADEQNGHRSLVIRLHDTDAQTYWDARAHGATTAASIGDAIKRVADTL